MNTWLATQRNAKKKGKLNTDQITRFDEIGVVWRIKN